MRKQAWGLEWNDTLGDLASEGWTESFLENLELHSGDRRRELDVAVWA